MITSCRDLNHHALAVREQTTVGLKTANLLAELYITRNMYASYSARLCGHSLTTFLVTAVRRHDKAAHVIHRTRVFLNRVNYTAEFPIDLAVKELVCKVGSVVGAVHATARCAWYDRILVAAAAPQIRMNQVQDQQRLVLQQLQTARVRDVPELYYQVACAWKDVGQYDDALAVFDELCTVDGVRDCLRG